VTAYGATIAKRRLSRRLVELRSTTTHTANQVCDKLGWGRGKLGRFESNTWKRPELSDIRDLLRFYQVSDDERRELEELARQARQRAWWREYSDVFADTEFPGFEADATRICLYMPLVLPGLLQTPAYTEAQMNVATQSPDWRKRALEARQRRQEILERDDETAPRIEAVITEASLLYRWGTRADGPTWSFACCGSRTGCTLACAGRSTSSTSRVGNHRRSFWRPISPYRRCRERRTSPPTSKYSAGSRKRRRALTRPRPN
jgi:transcriptional regulator with XRE-family HTH domain